MCFGPTKAEREAAAQQRAEAEEAQRQAASERAQTKQESLMAALSGSQVRRLGGGGKGRRSLFQSTQGAAGFLGRFNR